ncbi:MAG: hypothetical protein GXO43_01725 [Crenarchaeota archaeon]|nr:hypothetical protein [Thermoproteota archaeon]
MEEYSLSGWVKGVFYLGLLQAVLAILVSAAAVLGVIHPDMYEAMVIKGLDLTALFVLIISFTYFILCYRIGVAVAETISRFLSDAPRIGRFFALIGSVMTISSLALLVLYSLDPMYRYILYNILWIGMILDLLSLSSWLLYYGEDDTASQVFIGLIFPVSGMILYSLITSIYMYTPGGLLLILGSNILVWTLVYPLIMIMLGFEPILSRQESYLVGSTYTVGALVLALYIVQVLTLYMTTSILGDKLAALKTLPTYILLDTADKLGLVIISYKIFLSLILLGYILYFIASMVMMRKKPVLPKVY